MIFLIQRNLFSIKHEGRLIELLDKYKLEYYHFDQIPFIDDVKLPENLNLTNDVWLFGSVRANLNISKLHPEMYPGSFYNLNHNYEVYSNYYQDNLLNYDSIVTTPEYNIDEYQYDEFFARPVEDNKIFTGQVFTKDEWKSFIVKQLTNGHTHGLNINTKIQIASCKNIIDEIRVYIIKGKPITASYYKKNGYVNYQQCHDIEVFDFVQNMIDEYMIAESFVMDVCHTNDGLKIVECGCINSCGFYDIDLSKLLQSIIVNYNCDN